MVSAAQLRRFLRWAHIAEAAFLGFYLYSPAHDDPTWTGIARAVVFPLAALSGAWMWQQARIGRALRAHPRHVAQQS